MTTTRPRRLTKPQRARAARVFRRAVDAADASIGARLIDRTGIMQGGEPHRWYASERLADADMTYTLWMWAERTPESN